MRALSVLVAVLLFVVTVCSLWVKGFDTPTAAPVTVDVPTASPDATVTAPERTATEAVSGVVAPAAEILANPTPTTELPARNLESAPANPSPSDEAWDRLAQCESSQRWDLPPDRYGQSGGLQILDRTWAAYGGLDFAAAPYLATAAQQIVVSERILAAQGVRAWPVCGPRSGLG